MLTFNHLEMNNLEIKSLLQQELFKRGILWSGFHNMSYSHTDDDINYTLNVYETVLKLLKNVIINNDIENKLLGEPVKAVFRKTDNFNVKPVSN